jgi:uncharacterized protein
MFFDIIQVVKAVFSGSLVGFSLGLIGGGGSILATPLLLYFVGVSSPHIAIGTSALAVSLNAFANFFGHVKRKNVQWQCASAFAIIGAFGALLGSSIGKIINGQMLLFLFGILMIAVGVLMLRQKGQNDNLETIITNKICVRTAIIALFTGMASGFFGIGGGFLIVPALMFATQMSMIKAIGSSLLAVGAFGLTTAINYAMSGQIDWLIAAEFIFGGIIGGIIGTAIAHKLAPQKGLLNKIFASVIFIVALYVIYKSGSIIFT